MGDLMAELAKETAGRHGYTRVGAVVGATYPEELSFLRERLRATFFLVPGSGAQGGGAADAAGAFGPGGRGAIVNSSRAIICAWQKTETTAGLRRGRARRGAQDARRPALRHRFWPKRLIVCKGCSLSKTTTPSRTP
jgi:orotidine-5'-phosphate decarboxylase